MKKVFCIILITLLSSLSTFPSEGEIRLPDCIDAALNNRGNIRALRIEAMIASLQTSEAVSKFLPQISLVYDLRYNILTPSQIIPVGLFSPVPTDETRAIRFGTDWQQNAGITIYYPLIDFSIRSRVAESRISEKLKNSDLATAEIELKSEVIRTFTSVWLREEQVRAAALDTFRTFRTLELVSFRSDEGRALRTDLNRAAMNHNNARAAYRNVLSGLYNDKVYLSFLTGAPLEFLLEGDYDFTVFKNNTSLEVSNNPAFDSIPGILQLELMSELAGQQKRTERSRYIPILGLEGFAGANQYTDSFDPFLASRWYGSSFVGLNLRLPVITGDNRRSRMNQLGLQAEGLRSRLVDERSLISNRVLRLNEEISQLGYQITLLNQNIELLEENILLYQERFREGQLNAYDMITQEIDLQMERSKRNEQLSGLVKKQIEIISTTGRIDSFIDSLR